jgi:N-methylhydantoinase A
VLVPRFAGALSALGILRADVVKDYSRTVRLSVSSAREVQTALRAAFSRIERYGVREMQAEGFRPSAVRVERWLDVRYVGQAYELGVSAVGDFVAAFHRAHKRRYGYADPSRPTEVVSVRARMIGATPKPILARERPSGSNAKAALTILHRSVFAGRLVDTPVYDRAKLRAGNRFTGPAIVSEYSATTVVPPGWRARVDSYGNLVLTR